MKPNKDHLIATFSIVGYDAEKKEWGIAVQSKFLAVGAYVPYAKANVGAIATQAWCNSTFGPKGLELLSSGMGAEEVLEVLLKDDPGKESRQVGVIDANGHAATFTGKDCYNWAGGSIGNYCACQGNILVSEDTVNTMRHVFENTTGELCYRLVSALDAGQNAGGDSRGRQSAAVLVVREKGGYGGYDDRVIDLRVDDHKEPIKELLRLMDLHKLYFGTTKPGNTVILEGDLLLEVKDYLMKRGLLDNSPHSEEGATFSEALKRYYMTENFDDRCHEEGYLDLEVLDFMRAQAQTS